MILFDYEVPESLTKYFIYLSHEMKQNKENKKIL
jgi:hypothetical protein